MELTGRFPQTPQIKLDANYCKIDPLKERTASKEVPVHVERVLVNDTAQIKCDVSSNLPNDRILLVVWYKDNLPIYSYDTRTESNKETPSHWRDGNILGDRANFKPMRDKSRAELVISPVLKKDAGVFRCRVDFSLSPTKNSNVNLEIVVPPDVPRIHDSNGFELPQHAGPFEEGGILELNCIVSGGIPTPKITWTSNGKVLPSTMMEYSHEGTLSSKLVVRNLSRNHQHSVYSCQASNFYKRNVTANVTIELRLRPLVVEIINGSTPLSSDRRYAVQCQSSGSRPPAKITWWKEGEQLTATNQTRSQTTPHTFRKPTNRIWKQNDNDGVIKDGQMDTFSPPETEMGICSFVVYRGLARTIAEGRTDRVDPWNPNNRLAVRGV
ncbi:hemicentin-2-like [Uranotaenia lowii]|uniref:hemicentin-2-like n=1 Tax=Uranotaenia lowii TaxID=190385 RepID=UPI00247A4808|nr:hemicentin-2-like [Uranotaenia lowii]